VLQCPEVVRCTAVYRGPSLVGRTVFHALVGRVPTEADCRDVCATVLAWETDGAYAGGSWALLRDSRTALVRLESRSLDARRRATYVWDAYPLPFAGRVAVPGPIPSAEAPLIRWECLPGQPRGHGRTYAVGLSALDLATDDVNQWWGGAVEAASMSATGLVSLFLRAMGAPMVLLSYRAHGAALVPALVSVVDRATVRPGGVGTQRRRLPGPRRA
jgi:hypothetical protein